MKQKKRSDEIRIQGRMRVAPQVEVQTLERSGQVEWEEWISIYVLRDIQVLDIVQVKRLANERQVQREG